MVSVFMFSRGHNLWVSCVNDSLEIDAGALKGLEDEDGRQAVGDGRRKAQAAAQRAVD